MGGKLRLHVPEHRKNAWAGCAGDFSTKGKDREGGNDRAELDAIWLEAPASSRSSSRQHGARSSVPDGTGPGLPGLANVLIALRTEPELRDALAFDEMLQESMVLKPPPVASGSEPGEEPPKKVTTMTWPACKNGCSMSGCRRSAARSSAKRSKSEPATAAFTRSASVCKRSSGTASRAKSTWLKVYLGASGAEDYLTAIGRCSSSRWSPGSWIPVARSTTCSSLKASKGR